MARPKKDPNEKLTELMQSRMTVADKHDVQEYARNAGLSTSEFIRRRALGLEVEAIPPAMDTDALIQLSRIGNNVNQIATRLNHGDEYDHGWNETREKLTALIDTLAERLV